MNNVTKLFAVIFLTVVSTMVNAQTLKFGHIDLQALIQVMPERVTMETEFNNFQKELEDVLMEMQQNYQAKLKEFEQLGKDASEIKRNAKISELQDMQQRMQNYQESGQQQVQQKYQELLKPLLDKANAAIAEIGKELGLMYVFEMSSNAILYKSNESIDVLLLVKKKLGIEK